MRRILLWGRMLPYEAVSAADILLKNKIASNTGNLLFTASVARAVLTQDAQLIPFYSEDVDPMLADGQIFSGGVDCAIIPLANAFREDFRVKLRNLTRFIRAARFPCHIVGVGFQAQQDARIADGFSFDADVKDFMAAALEKTGKIGVRGAYTAEYLKHLGFGESCVSVIGCPSAYYYGGACRQTVVLPFEALRHVVMTVKRGLKPEADAFLRRSAARFEDVRYGMQDIYELWAMYFRFRPLRGRASDPSSFYTDVRGGLPWQQGRVTAYLRAADWLDAMAKADFALGTRIHGMMASFVAGTPGVCITTDLRMRELAEYHGLPFLPADCVTAESDVRDLYERADFGAFARLYPQNFTRYVDFLNENGIAHIYGEAAPAFGAAPYDRAMRSAIALPKLYSGMPVPLGDRLRKPEMYGMYLKYALDKRRGYDAKK